MKVLGLVGWSGAGKTTLIERMLPLLTARGLAVSTIKHARHGFDLDRPGKDSWRHREAGAREVLVASDTNWALLHAVRGPEPGLAALLARLAPVDLVLVEGFKTHPYPKIEVHRAALGKPPIWPEQADIVAVASDTEPRACDRALLALNDAGQIVAWTLHFLQISKTLSGCRAVSGNIGPGDPT